MRMWAGVAELEHEGQTSTQRISVNFSQVKKNGNPERLRGIGFASGLPSAQTGERKGNGCSH